MRPAADGAAAAGCTGWCGMSVALGGATACCDIPVISSQACVSGYKQHINIGSKVPAPAALAPGQLAELAAGRGGAHSRGSGAFAGTSLAGPGAEFNNGGSEPDCPPVLSSAGWPAPHRGKQRGTFHARRQQAPPLESPGWGRLRAHHAAHIPAALSHLYLQGLSETACPLTANFEVHARPRGVAAPSKSPLPPLRQHLLQAVAPAENQAVHRCAK